MVAILETFMRNRFKVSEQRLSHCRECEQFVPSTTQCKECGCVMNFKTYPHSLHCVVEGKWEKIEIEEKKDLTSDKE